jgi:tetratricopeptide (TPR) repeat protein
MIRNLGRNDPCWCGSGKKYKNCHLREDETARARAASKSNLMQWLNDYALRQFEKDFKSATEFFFGRDIMSEGEQSQQLVQLGQALEYFVYDFRLPNNQRVIERFVAEQGKRLSAEERALVDDWIHSRPALYEIIDVRRGEGMRLRDLITGEEFDVREKRATEQVSQWDILFSRVMRMRDHYELAGAMGMVIPARFRGWLRGHVENLWHNYAAKHPDATYEDFLHTSSQLVNQFILDQVAPAMMRPPTLVTMEGDLIEFITATFDVLDYPLALAGLRAAEEFVEVGGEEEANERSFSWHEVGESLALLRAHGPAFEYKPPAPRGSPDARRALGSLHLTRDELVVEVTSRRRLDACRELLAKHLGSAIQFRGEQIKPVEDLLARTRKESPEEEAAPEETEEEMSEEMEALQAQMMGEAHRAWLDEKVPALGDKTPREAVKTLGGRVQVIRLIKEFQRVEDMRARDGMVAYDFTEMKTQLGLTEQDFLDETRLEDRLKDELAEIKELALADRVDEALAAWRAFRRKYSLARQSDLEFAEVWNLMDAMSETVRELANRLAIFHRYDEGIALLQEYIALEPDDADTSRAKVIEMRMERGEIEQGLSELAELAERVPENFSVQMLLAEVQRDLLDRPDDAIVTYQRAREYVEEDFEEAEIYEGILDTYLEAHRLDEAEQFWHTENDGLEELDQDYFGWTKLTLARGDLARARESVKKIDREIVRTYWTGIVESLAGNFAAARKAWAGHLEEPPLEEWMFWFQWAELHLRLHEVDLVIKKINPVKMDRASAYFDVALAYAFKGDLVRAAKLAREARNVMERRERRIHFKSTLRDVRELADALQLSPAARQALTIAD